MFLVFFLLLFITQGKAQNFACINKSSNVYIKSGECLFTRVFSPALHCYSASSQIIAAHICCGDCSAHVVHDNASLLSSLSNTTCTFHLPQGHQIYSSSNLGPESVQKTFLQFFFLFPHPQAIKFLGISDINFGFKICSG